MGLILVTHDIAVLARMTDRLAVMHEGEIVEQGATEQLMRDMSHPYGERCWRLRGCSPNMARRRGRHRRPSWR